MVNIVIEKITFNLLKLLEVSSHPGERYVHPKKLSQNTQTQFSLSYDKTYYEVHFECTNDYLWIAADFGKPIPRADQLIDVNTGSKKTNPRKDTEAELLKKFFFLYSFVKQTAYLSNSQKVNAVLEILQEKTRTTYKIQKIYKSPEDFISILKGVEEISFTHVSDLLSSDSERNSLKDLTGTDAPERFTITAKYYEKSLEKIIRFLTKKLGTHEHDMIIQGLDEDHFPVVFNGGKFQQSIEIYYEKDADGRFVFESVKTKLLEKINEIN